MSTEVQLAVYDLSRGMARNLSAQFLGPQYAIDAIPHTGVVVYGMEYFFGGGIQCEHPAALRQMTGILPLQIVTVGRTRVSREAFEGWCRRKMSSGEFSMASYDLLHHNCNDFCQAALQEGLQLQQGVPQWILDVPRRFLSSPMGQMIRPMLENMQLGRVDGAQTINSSTSTAPFAGAAPSLGATATATTSVPNPWAQPAPTTTEAASRAASTSNTAANPWAHAPAASAASTPNKTRITYEILEAHKMPLLANETTTVSMCVEKLVAFASTDEEAQDLRAVGKALSTSNSNANASIPAARVTAACTFLLRCLESNHKITFALMLVRLLALQQHAHANNPIAPCIEWIVQQLVAKQDGSGGAPLQSPASRAMSWLVLSNVVAKNASSSSSLLFRQENDDNTDTLMETSIRDLLPEWQPRVQVRQAVAAFLYNVVLVAPTHLPLAAHDDDGPTTDNHVSILCAALDEASLASETDETVRFRRLLAAARILSPVPTKAGTSDAKKPPRHEATAQLVADLGFPEALENLAQKHAQVKSGKLAREILALVSSD